MKQTSLFVFVPIKDFPQRGVLNPLDAGNFTERQGAFEQLLDHVELFGVVGQRHKLKDQIEAQISH